MGMTGRYAKDIMHAGLGSRQCDAIELQRWSKHVYWDGKCREQVVRLHTQSHV